MPHCERVVVSKGLEWCRPPGRAERRYTATNAQSCSPLALARPSSAPQLRFKEKPRTHQNQIRDVPQVPALTTDKASPGDEAARAYAYSGTPQRRLEVGVGGGRKAQKFGGGRLHAMRMDEQLAEEEVADGH